MFTACKVVSNAQYNTSLELFSLYHLTRFLWLQSVSDVLYSVITVSNIEKIFVKHTCISWSICWRNSVLVISHEWSPEQCLSIVWERRWLWWTRHARCWSQDTAERDNVEWHTSVRTRSLVSDLRRESWSVLTTRHTLQLILWSTPMLSSQSLNVFIRWRVWTQYVEGGDHHQHSSKWQYKKLQKNVSAETCLLMCKYLAHLHRILCNRNCKEFNQIKS